MGDAARLPENPAPHLTDWLFEIGPRNSDGGAISWRDMQAWRDIVGIELEPWEGRLIKNLSEHYASMRSRADKPDCAEPYAMMLVPEECRDQVSSQFAAMMAAFTGQSSQS